MSFSAATSLPALTSAASKKPADELRDFAAGIIAHVAIQTVYRLEHPGNFIITERSVWVGDTQASTISKILDKVDRVVDLAKAAAKAAAKGSKPQPVGTSSEQLWVALIYLIDFSTNLSFNTENFDAWSVVRKRYDIVDFGPMVISPVSPSRFGEAYEIKTERGTKEGKQFITTRVDNYNQSLSKLKDHLKKALNVSGLGGYQLRLGQSWPAPQTWVIGPNILTFWLEAPGLIVYRWLSFKRLSFKRLRDHIRQVEAELRKFFETRSSLKPEVSLALIFVTTVSVFTVGIILVPVLEAAGGALIRAGDVLARLAQIGALGGTSAASAAAAPPKRPATDTSAQQAAAAKVNEVLAAFEKMDDLDLSFMARLTSRPPASTQESLSGGTPQTPSEQALYKMVDTLVTQTISLYSVQIGQGNEFLSEFNLSILKENLTLWIGSFVSAYGLENLLKLTGQNQSSELNEETALQVAEVILAAARGNLEATHYDRFLIDFFSLSSEAVDESLPRGYDEDGESFS